MHACKKHIIAVIGFFTTWEIGLKQRQKTDCLSLFCFSKNVTVRMISDDISLSIVILIIPYIITTIVTVQLLIYIHIQ